jgi:hypothetical protein
LATLSASTTCYIRGPNLDANCEANVRVLANDAMMGADLKKKKKMKKKKKKNSI